MCRVCLLLRKWLVDFMRRLIGALSASTVPSHANENKSIVCQDTRSCNHCQRCLSNSMQDPRESINTHPTGHQMQIVVGPYALQECCWSA